MRVVIEKSSCPIEAELIGVKDGLAQLEGNIVVRCDSLAIGTLERHNFMKHWRTILNLLEKLLAKEIALTEDVLNKIIDDYFDDLEDL